MRFSETLIITSKETPKDATLISHIYLLRGGYIQQISSGIYNFLPLGKMVLENIASVIREELNRAGCLEVQLGFVTPTELWQKSNRLDKYGKELLRFNDRKDQNYVLGPTHEEMMVELAKAFIKSYKQLPKNIYQINLKFRDEIRPRFGLMRAREFVMKDGYSFHADIDDMLREFNLMEETYKKIFTRLGLDFRIVEADSGAIGGSGSKEFMVLADSGEDTIVLCSSCSYAANIEAAKRAPQNRGINEPDIKKGEYKTPNKTKIEDVASFFGVDSYFVLKAVMKKAIYDDNKSELVVFFLRGSDDLQETKAANAINANILIDPTEEELIKAKITTGFIGPFGLDIKMVFDEELKGSKNLICGANKIDYHLAGMDLNELESPFFYDIKEIKEGDSCPKCGNKLMYKKGIEVGHIFQLNTRYSEPLEATFLDKDGKAKPFVMGTYGIGVSRLIQAIIEQHHDEKGIVWTKESAPFLVEIIISNIKDKEQRTFGEQLYKELLQKGVSVILDDRNERFGSKITDFELLGFLYCIIIGKSLQENKIEIVKRAGLDRIEVSKDEVVDRILELLA